MTIKDELKQLQLKVSVLNEFISNQGIINGINAKTSDIVQLRHELNLGYFKPDLSGIEQRLAYLEKENSLILQGNTEYLTTLSLWRYFIFYLNIKISTWLNLRKYSRLFIARNIKK